MMTKEQIELIAERYGIGCYYLEPGNGGFVLDSSGDIYQSMKIDIKEMFQVEENKLKPQEEYSISDDSLLFAA